MITLEQWKDHEQRRTAIELLPHQIQVLLSSIWANHVLHLFEQKYPNDDRPRKAIEIAFDFALTGKNVVDAAAAWDSAAWDSASAAYADVAAYCAARAAACAYVAASHDRWAAFYVYHAAAADAADANNWDFIYNTYLRSINQIQFNPSWKTEQTVGIAKQIWENRNVGNLPILADALQDAGVEENLTELRNIDQYTTLANWWLWNLNLEKQ